MDLCNYVLEGLDLVHDVEKGVLEKITFENKA